MAIIILDENFYKEDIFYKEYDYLNKAISFISKYIDADIAIFMPNIYSSNIWSQNNSISHIFKLIQKYGNFRIFDSNEVKSICNVDFNGLSDNFTGQLFYVHNTEDIVILITSPENQNKDLKIISDFIYVVNHVTKETNSNFSKWVSEGTFVKNIKIPSDDNPLPNLELIEEYMEILTSKLCGKSIPERIPVILEVTGEVLRRNGYKLNEFLTSINTTSNKIRKVYDNNSFPIFGCIDVDTGSIEICYRDGKHNDEYGFDNKPHFKHDPTGGHDIKLHK